MSNEIENIVFPGLINEALIFKLECDCEMTVYRSKQLIHFGKILGMQVDVVLHYVRPDISNDSL